MAVNGGADEGLERFIEPSEVTQQVGGEARPEAVCLWPFEVRGLSGPVSHRKWTMTASLRRKKKDTQGFGEESREPGTGKAFLDSNWSMSERTVLFSPSSTLVFFIIVFVCVRVRWA